MMIKTKTRYLHKGRAVHSDLAGLLLFGWDEISVEVHVDAGGDGGSGDLLEGFGVEDEHEGRDVWVRRDNGGQDHS